MKKLMAFLFVFTIILICLCTITMPMALLAQDSTATGSAGDGGSSFGDFLKEHWGVLLPAFLVFVEAVIRLTPSERDNSIFNFIKRLIDVILPNKAAKTIGGGKLGFLPARDMTTNNVVIKDAIPPSGGKGKPQELPEGKAYDPETGDEV